MSRGDRREEIFQDDVNRKKFSEVLGRGCEKTGWQIQAYSLMRNHFHFAERPRE
jgi:putative transposase